MAPEPQTHTQTDILFVTHNFPRDDTDFAGRFIWRLARELTGRDLKVSVLTPHHPGAREQEVMDGIDVRRFRYGPDEKENVAYRGDLDRWSSSSAVTIGATLRFLRAFGRETAKEISRLRPGVVHAHWWIPAGWMAKKSYRSAGAKFIITSHGTDIRMLAGQRWLRYFARRTYRAAHEITTVSTWLKNDLCRWFPELAQKISVIPMPVDRGPFLPGKPPQNDIPVVLSVARFVQQKRLFDLMDAAEILKARGRPFRFRLVGEGPLGKELHDRRFVRGLADEVTLVPMMSAQELADEYRRADLVVLCSENEGFGMTLVEAQLCGTPVIGTRSGGITDIIEDGKSGLLVYLGKPEELADAIEYLIVDVQERRRLAEAGLQSAQQNFDPEQIAQRFLKLYARN
jgi:glycosyltransferase involved in cell wall biosynthesis